MCGAMHGVEGRSSLVLLLACHKTECYPSKPLGAIMEDSDVLSAIGDGRIASLAEGQVSQCSSSIPPLDV